MITTKTKTLAASLLASLHEDQRDTRKAPDPCRFADAGTERRARPMNTAPEQSRREMLETTRQGAGLLLAWSVNRQQCQQGDTTPWLIRLY